MQAPEEERLAELVELAEERQRFDEEQIGGEIAAPKARLSQRARSDHVLEDVHESDPVEGRGEPLGDAPPTAG